MRWEHLFDDLESQLELELGAEALDLLAEEERLRLGRLALRDRIRAMVPTDGTPSVLRMELLGGTRIELALGAIGRDWVAGELPASGHEKRSCIVPLASVVACLPDAEQLQAGLAVHPVAGPAAGMGELAAKLGLAFVLRDLCRRRVAVQLTTTNAAVHGTIDRVARDHFDLAEHEVGTQRRAAAIRGHWMIPTDHLVLLRF